MMFIFIICRSFPQLNNRLVCNQKNIGKRQGKNIHHIFLELKYTFFV